MAWKDGLRAASFRGVEFFFDDAGLDNACRRVETHQFPFRDTSYSEDLGRQAESFPIEAYVVGDDYMEKRDALREACEAEGPGELIHPYYGSVQVLCTACSIRESSQEGRVARFSLTFVEAGEKNYPGETKDRRAVIKESADTLKSVSAAELSSSFSIDGFPEFIGFEAVEDINKFLDTIGSTISDITTLVRKPYDLAVRIQSLITSYVDKLSDGESPAVQTVRTAAQIAEYGEWKTSGTDSRMKQRSEANANAVVSLVRQSAAADAAETAVNLDFESRQEAEEARDAVTEAIDEAAEHTENTETYLALTDLRVELTESVPADGLPELITKEIRSPRPSLVVAYEVYGDALRGDEIVRRNSIRHPGFVRGEIELLSEASA